MVLDLINGNWLLIFLCVERIQMQFNSTVWLNRSGILVEDQAFNKLSYEMRLEKVCSTTVQFKLNSQINTSFKFQLYNDVSRSQNGSCNVLRDSPSGSCSEKSEDLPKKYEICVCFVWKIEIYQ